MKFKILIICTILVIINASVSAQDRNIEEALETITEQSSEAILTYLSSDWMEGRELGKKGQAMASDYIASMFQLYMLKPVSNLKDPFAIVDNLYFPDNVYFQNFPLIKLNTSKDHKLGIIKLGFLNVWELANMSE